MTSVATGRTYDTVHLATSSRASRILVAAQAGDVIDRTLIPVIHEPGVTDDQGYTAEQRLVGSPISLSAEPGKTKDVEQPPEEPVTEDREYLEIQVPGARVPSRILLAPVGHPQPSDKHIERMKAIYDPQVARDAMNVYEGRKPKHATAKFEPKAEAEPEPAKAEAAETPTGAEEPEEATKAAAEPTEASEEAKEPEAPTEEEPSEPEAAAPHEEPAAAAEADKAEQAEQVAPEPKVAPAKAAPVAHVAKKAVRPAKRAPHKRAD